MRGAMEGEPALVWGASQERKLQPAGGGPVCRLLTPHGGTDRNWRYDQGGLLDHPPVDEFRDALEDRERLAQAHIDNAGRTLALKDALCRAELIGPCRLSVIQAVWNHGLAPLQI